MSIRSFVYSTIQSVLRGFKIVSPKTEKFSAKAIQKTEDKRSVRKYLNRYMRARAEQGMDALRDAIDLAKDPVRHDRSHLYDLYESFEEDTHLLGVRRIWKNKVMKQGYSIVDKKGNPDEVAKEKVDKRWMLKFWEQVLDTVLWGHSLLQANLKDGEVSEMELIPRTHVSPEFGRLYVNPWYEGDYYNYREDLKEYLMELGEKEDYGILAVIGKEITRKNYSDSDWGRHSERFGMPTVLLKSKETRDSELDKKEEALANLGSSGYMLLDGETDEADYLESHINTPYMMYERRMEMAHNLINLIVLGSASLGQEQAFVGSAEVAERTADDFVLASLRDITYYVNEVLFPHLAKNGYTELAGKKIRFNALKEEDKTQPPKEKTPEAPVPGEKKKLTLDHPEGEEAVCCGGVTFALEEETKSALQKLMEGIGKSLWGDKIGDNAWSNAQFTELVELVSGEIWGAFKEKFTSEGKWDIKTYSLAKKVQENVFHFSGAKSLTMLEEMKGRLFDGERKRSWKEYREEILKLNSTYNVSYLETERNSAALGGTMAGKWEQQVERNKDLYPYLKYVTEGDVRVRAEHERMNGITLPVDSEFWSKFYPPNGWNCRCDIEQMSEDDYEEYKSEREELGEAGMVVFDEEKAVKTGEEQIKDKFFHRNTGKNGILYPETHRYFKQFGDKDKDRLNTVARDNRVTDFNIMKSGFKKKTKKGVWVHEDERMKEGSASYLDNMIPLERLAADGWECKKIPEIGNGRLYHNCDAIISKDGVTYLAETKRIKGKGDSGLTNAIRKVYWRKKTGIKPNSVLIDLRESKKYTLDAVMADVGTNLPQKRHIKNLILIDYEGNISIYPKSVFDTWK